MKSADWKARITPVLYERQQIINPTTGKPVKGSGGPVRALTVDFSVPMAPLPMNAWRKVHWSVRAKEQKRWRAALTIARLAMKKSDRICVDPADVYLTFTHPRRRDPDGLAKCVLDAVKSAGFIVDDGPPHLRQLTLRCLVGPEIATRVQVEPAGWREE